MNLPAAAATVSPRAILGILAAAATPAAHHSNPFIHLLLSFGLVGVFFVSIVDSSFIPLPIPGLTDIMVIVLAAQHQNLFLLLTAATAGSFLGGFFSYKVGQSGGMAFLEKHVPARFLKPVCHWMESHAILAVALPAILPPPMPLSPFVLAAGALKMSRQTFLTAFTSSRFGRHALAAWLGVHYGRHVLHIWNMFSRKWADPTLITIWSIILVSAGIGCWKLYRATRTVGHSDSHPMTPATEA